MKQFNRKVKAYLYITFGVTFWLQMIAVIVYTDIAGQYYGLLTIIWIVGMIAAWLLGRLVQLEEELPKRLVLYEQIYPVCSKCGGATIDDSGEKLQYRLQTESPKWMD
jgi:hypothetical protein